MTGSRFGATITCGSQEMSSTVLWYCFTSAAQAMVGRWLFLPVLWYLSCMYKRGTGSNTASYRVGWDQWFIIEAVLGRKREQMEIAMQIF